MSTEVNDDDVVFARDPSMLFTGTTTFKVIQLKEVLKQQLINASKIQHIGEYWFTKGIQCEVLNASSGGGWKTAKIRLRLEIVVDEPEPKPEPMNNDPNSLDSLRSELYPKQ